MRKHSLKTPGAHLRPVQSQLWVIDKEGRMFISKAAVDASLIMRIKISG